MPKIISVKDAVNHIKSGMTVHVGGFYNVGTPENIVDEIIASGINNLHVINNDGGSEFEGAGRLIYAGCVKKLTASWCGLNPKVKELVDSGDMELEFCPQGTLVERIRAAGFGLGGVLTKTGLGTEVESKWGQRVTLNGQDYLYHAPIHADVAVVEAYMSDKLGNLVFRRTQCNFNQVMCTAADYVIASIVMPIKEIGELDPDEIMVPGAMVDAIIQR